MTEREIDKILIAALEDAICVEYQEAVNAPVPVSVPSRRYQREIRRMLKDPLRYAANYRRPVWQKALRAAAAVFLALLMTFSVAMTIPPVRAVVVKCFTTWYEEYVSIRFPGDSSAITDGGPGDWYIAAIPEGYTENVSSTSAGSKRVVYTHETEPEIHFSAYLTASSLNLGTDIERSTQTIITINGHDAYRFDRKSAEGFNHLVWYDEAQEYVFRLSGKVPMETLLGMACSLTKNS